MDHEERLKMAKELDVKKLMAEMEKNGEPLTEEQALITLHRARYVLARMKHLDRKYYLDSRRWLANNGHRLPD